MNLNLSRNAKRIGLWLMVAAVTGLTAVRLVADNGKEELPKARMTLIARTDRDSVVLRWGVGDRFGWLIGNEKGYVVERATINPDNSVDAFTLLTIVKPWTKDRVTGLPKTADKTVITAGQLLYNTGITPGAADPQGVGEVVNESKKSTMRHSFAHFCADVDPMAAEVLGLRFVDKNVRPGQKYVYRVYIPARRNDLRMDTALVYVSVADFSKAPAPIGFSAIGLDGNVALTWNKIYPTAYSAYNIERSEDGVNFKRINANPIVPMTYANLNAALQKNGMYSDTTIQNYRTYTYRISGITPFGDATEYATATASGSDMTPPAEPVLEEPKQRSTKTVALAWSLPAPSTDVAGFDVERAEEATGNFTKINTSAIAPSVHSFVDNNATRDEAYYRITVFDTAGNRRASMPVHAAIIDSTPPAMPTGLKATIDTAGVVRLTWNAPKDKHVIGYRVLWANAPEHEFSQLTERPWEDTTYTDTVLVNTLTPYVYYKVVAENDLYRRSEPTPMLALKRPDIVVPAQSVFNNVKVTEKLITLEWAVSPSKDLAKQILMRRESGTTEWKPLVELGRGVGSYTDKDAARRINYDYTLITVDSSGLKSQPCTPVMARAYGSDDAGTIQNFTASFDEKKGTVVLNWNHPGSKAPNARFIIYRAKDNRAMTQYKAVDVKENHFEDRLVSAKGNYTYAVLLSTDNGDTPMSGKAMVNVK